MFASQTPQKTSRCISCFAALLLLTSLPSVHAGTLIPTGSVWKYATGDLGSAWRQPGFNDSSWDSGPAPLGFGDSHIVTILPSGVPGTYYFRESFANPSFINYLTLRLLRDDGAVVYLNGVEVWRSNMPNGPISAFALARSDVSGDDETRYLEFVFPAFLFLVPGTNVLAVEVHQSDFNSSDLGFDLGLSTEAPVNPGPRVVSAIDNCANQIRVTFDKPVEPIMLLDEFNYYFPLSNGDAVYVAEVIPGPDNQTVILIPEQPLSLNQSSTLYTCCFCEPDFANCGGEQVTPITLDVTPPTVSCSVAVDVLFPPNNRPVNVGLSASSSEANWFVKVFSDEPGSVARFSNGVLQLPASRDNAADGRVYLVVVTSTDACGNVGVCCTTVVVPHNASAAALASVQAQAAASRAQCSANGSPSTPIRLPVILSGSAGPLLPDRVGLPLEQD